MFALMNSKFGRLVSLFAVIFCPVKLKRFFNTSGLLYKSMGLKDKLPQMSEDEMLKLLATDGMLVKRPLLVSDEFVLVGFKETEWTEQLKNK